MSRGEARSTARDADDDYAEGERFAAEHQRSLRQGYADGGSVSDRLRAMMESRGEPMARTLPHNPRAFDGVDPRSLTRAAPDRQEMRGADPRDYAMPLRQGYAAGGLTQAKLPMGLAPPRLRGRPLTPFPSPPPYQPPVPPPVVPPVTPVDPRGGLTTPVPMPTLPAPIDTGIRTETPPVASTPIPPPVTSTPERDHYYVGTAQTTAPTADTSLGIPSVIRMARGGLSAMLPNQQHGPISGEGTGRSDSIPAQLSDGEYVLDAEFVAMLGDGSTKAGAAKLDQMRENIRRHKGGALSRGKISPDARAPEQYLGGRR